MCTVQLDKRQPTTVLWLTVSEGRKKLKGIGLLGTAVRKALRPRPLYRVAGKTDLVRSHHSVPIEIRPVLQIVAKRTQLGRICLVRTVSPLAVRLRTLTSKHRKEACCQDLRCLRGYNLTDSHPISVRLHPSRIVNGAGTSCGALLQRTGIYLEPRWPPALEDRLRCYSGKRNHH